MGSDLIPLGSGSGLPARVERQLSRELATIAARGMVTAAREAAKIEAVSHVTEEGLFAVSQISAIEGLLINRTPHAARRLQHVADSGAAGIADIVLRTGRRMAS